VTESGDSGTVASAEGTTSPPTGEDTGSTGTTEVGSEATSDLEETSDPHTESESSSGDPVPECGNGLVESTEMCDGGPGCTNQCTLENFSCNPVTNAGCDPSRKCTYYEGGGFECLLWAEPVGAADESCPDLYGSNHCEIGLGCFGVSCGSGFCCTPWCDLNDVLATCPEGQACRGLWSYPGENLGLEWLGFCVTS